jgi:HAD superfamily hydrolase (TIGR01509 family)
VIKALIFDFDGLIMDTETPKVEAWKAIYADYGQEFPLHIWVREVVGSSVTNFDAAAHLAELTGQELDQPSLHARARAFYLERLGKLPALRGVNDYVNAARRLGLRLAVASCSTHAWVEGYLRQLGLFNDFESIICLEDVRLVKPDPEPFLKTLEALHLRADQALVFEDSSNGVLAARRAGLRVVVIPNPITADASIEPGSLVLSSLADLPLEELLKWMEVDIRLETPADIPGIRAVEQQAFPTAVEAGLVDLCRQRGRIILSLVAARSGPIIGHILFTPVTCEPPRDHLRGLGLGPVAVLPACQRIGIGSRLIRAGLELCRARGYDFIVLLGDPRYYSRFGFTPARAFGLSSDYGDDDEFQVLELHPDALSGISGRVKYVPEFNEMNC